MVETTTLGGTASHVVVGKVAHGLMMMTWKETPVPDEQAFEAIKAGIDSLPEGAKMMLNSGEFYGKNMSVTNLELVARFFDKFPQYAERTFLSVKGGVKVPAMEVDASPENLRRSIDTINATLRGTKRLDLFECARVDSKIPLEEIVGTLAGFIKEGKFDHLGMSECSAETLKRANAVYPVTAVEIEVSPWSYEEETKKVITTAEDLKIPVIAYSPLGRGFLTGQIQTTTDLEEGDVRRRLTRFKDENIQHNLHLVDALKKVAARIGVTPAQLSIAWVSSLGNHVIPLPGSSKATRTLENIAGGSVILSTEDKEEIGKVMEEHEVKGDRYYGLPPEQMHLWG